MDSNHDIVPTLRLKGGVYMSFAADEIERLRARVALLERRADDDESPAKVGGDEREIFESRLGRCKTYTEREFTMWVDGLRIGRAALSADGGDAAKHIEFLTSETDRLREALAYWQNRASELADVGEDKRDAERYRWLRDNPDGDVFVWDVRGAQYLECGRPLAGNGLDEAIDAAIAANQFGKGGE